MIVELLQIRVCWQALTMNFVTGTLKQKKTVQNNYRISESVAE
jgi:hypothetical protein